MACFSSVAGAVAALTLAAAGADPVVVATDAPFTPYTYVDEAQTISGFDREVMDEVCRRAALDCTWRLARLDELIPGLADGQFDIVIGGLAITPERRRAVEFSLPYHHAGGEEWFLGHPGAPEPDAARIAVLSGSLHEEWVRNEHLDFQAYSLAADAVAAVGSGKADLLFGPFLDRPEAEAMISAAGLAPLYSVEIADEGVAMAVCKGNTALRDRLDAALRAMIDDGTLPTLESRWF